MTHYIARDIVHAEHRRRFGVGRLRVRYTCGTCGTRSRWLRPFDAAEWFMDHNPACWDAVS